jgi:drug/metabolite transporter (DMT)-like permease
MNLPGRPAGVGDVSVNVGRSRAWVGSALLSADGALLVATVLYGLNYTVIKVGVSELEPLAFPVVRFGAAALILLVILRVREGSVGIARADIPLMALTGILGISISQVLFVTAMTQTTASEIALIIATGPIITTVLATLMGVERASRRHWFFAVVGLVGVVLIVVGGAGAEVDGSGSWGNAIALAFVVAVSAASIPLPWLLRRNSALRIVTYKMVIGTAVLVPFALPALAAQGFGAISPTGWGALLYATILAGIVTNLLYTAAVGNVGPSRAALYLYLEAFLGVLFAVILLGESVTAIQLVGGVIVIASLALSRDPRRPEDGIALVVTP